VTLTSTFTLGSGQAGSRVLNATGLTSNLDAFLTPDGAPTDTARLAGALRDSIAAFFDVPPGAASIRLATLSGASLLLDLDARPFRAGQRLTLAVRAPVAGGGATSPFIFEGC
jgi:hypothetical protein